MSRSIKFRLFNSRTKEWLCGYEELGGFHLLGELVLIGGIMDFSTTDLSNIVAMQYTGINDKNGVEIYEGDAIEVPNCIGVVVFEHGCFLLKWVNNTFRMRARELHIWAYKAKVIGNIHENPELLEDKQ